MQTFTTLTTQLFLAILILSVSLAKADLSKPNILFILTDDQRYDTIHALGNEHIQTPNIDRLVKSGVSSIALSPFFLRRLSNSTRSTLEP